MSKIRADEISNAADTGAPDFPNGLELSGSSATSFFRAALSSSQGIGSGSQSAVIFDTELVDNLNDYNTGTGRFTPSQAGYYLVGSRLNWNDIDTGVLTQVTIYKNGTRVAVKNEISGGSSKDIATNIMDIVHLNGTSDYVEIQAFNGDSVTRDVIGTGALDQSVFFAIRVI